jgi:hypothetical protein
MTITPIQPDSTSGSQAGKGATPLVPTSARDEDAHTVRYGLAVMTPTHSLYPAPGETLRLLAKIEEHERKASTAPEAEGPPGSNPASDSPIHDPMAL